MILLCVIVRSGVGGRGKEIFGFEKIGDIEIDKDVKEGGKFEGKDVKFIVFKVLKELFFRFLVFVEEWLVLDLRISFVLSY